MSIAPSDTLALERDREGTRLSWRRRQILTGACLRKPGVALEIGAFDNPTVRPCDGFEVRYADYFSSDELRQKYADNPRRDLSRIVEVDYVVKGPHLSPFIRDKVDLVLANHVIEHVSNPIGWLVDMASFCTEQANIFLAVPDKRFTFDYFKQSTDVGCLVRAYEERKDRPDAYDIARMRYLHAKVDPLALWDADTPRCVLAPIAPRTERYWSGPAPRRVPVMSMSIAHTIPPIRSSRCSKSCIVRDTCHGGWNCSLAWSVEATSSMPC